MSFSKSCSSSDCWRNNCSRLSCWCCSSCNKLEWNISSDICHSDETKADRVRRVSPLRMIVSRVRLDYHRPLISMKYPDSWLYPIFCCCTNSNPAKKKKLYIEVISYLYIYVRVYIYIRYILSPCFVKQLWNSVLLLLLCFPQGSVCFLLSIFHGLLPSLPPRTGARSRPKDQGLRAKAPEGSKDVERWHWWPCQHEITRDTHGTTSLWSVRSINMSIIFYIFL
jgi:hypothetical protein